MNAHRILMLALLVQLWCMASTGVGAADEVNVTLEVHLGGITEAVVVSGNYVCVGQEQDFVALDISSPATPSELSRLSTDGLVSDIVRSGDYVYVADGYDSLVIVDVSDRAAPVFAGNYSHRICVGCCCIR